MLWPHWRPDNPDAVCVRNPPTGKCLVWGSGPRDLPPKALWGQRLGRGQEHTCLSGWLEASNRRTRRGDHKARVGPTRIVLQPRDDPSRAIPGARRIVKFANQPVPAALVLVLLGQRQFGQRHPIEQRRVLLQPDDVVHPPVVKAAQRSRPAEPRVGPHDQSHLRPGLAQLRGQQLDQRTEHAGRARLLGRSTHASRS